MQSRESERDSTPGNEIIEGSFEHQCEMFLNQGINLLESEGIENKYEKLIQCFRVSNDWQNEIKEQLVSNISMNHQKLENLRTLLENLDQLKQELKRVIKDHDFIRDSHESELGKDSGLLLFENEQNEEDEEYDYEDGTEYDSAIKEGTFESKKTENFEIHQQNEEEEEENTEMNETTEIEEKQELKLGDNLSADALKQLYKKDNQYFKRLKTGDLVRLESDIKETQEKNGNKKIIKKIITLSMPKLNKDEQNNFKKSKSLNGKHDNDVTLEEFKERYSKNKLEDEFMICSNNESEKNIVKQESFISPEINSISKEKNIESQKRYHPSNENTISENNKNDNNTQSGSAYQEMVIPFESTNEMDNNTKTSSLIKESITNIILQSNRLTLQSQGEENIDSDIITPLRDHNEELSNTEKNFYKKDSQKMNKEEYQQEDIENNQTKNKFYPKKNSVKNFEQPDSNYFAMEQRIKDKVDKIPFVQSKTEGKHSINLDSILKKKNKTSIIEKEIDSSSHSGFRKINKTIDLQVEGVLDVEKSDFAQSKDHPKVDETNKISSFSELVKENCESSIFSKKQIEESKDKTSSSQSQKRKVIKIDHKSSNKNIHIVSTSKKQIQIQKSESPQSNSLQESKEIEKMLNLPSFLIKYVLPFIPFVHEDYRWIKLANNQFKIINANLDAPLNSNIKNLNKKLDLGQFLEIMSDIDLSSYENFIIAPLGFENKIIQMINSHRKSEVLGEVSIWSNESKRFFKDLIKLWKYSEKFSQFFNPVKSFINLKNELNEIKENFEEDLKESNIFLDSQHEKNLPENFKKDFLIFNGNNLNLLPFFSFKCNKDIKLMSNKNGNFDLKHVEKNSNLEQVLNLPKDLESLSKEYDESYVTMKNKSYCESKPFFLNDVQICKNNQKFCIYTSNDCEFRLVKGDLSNASKVLWFKSNLLINLKHILSEEEFKRFSIFLENENKSNNFMNNLKDEICKEGSGETKKVFFKLKYTPNNFKPGVKLFASRCGEIRILSPSQHKSKNVIWIQVATLTHSNKLSENSIIGDDGSVFRIDNSFEFEKKKNIKLLNNGKIKCLVDTSTVSAYSTNTYRIETHSKLREKLINSQNEKLNHFSNKKTNLTKFMKIRVNPFLTLPFLQIYCSSDGITKFIDTRKKFFSQIVYLPKEEDLPTIQNPVAQVKRLLHNTRLIRDPCLDQIGFCRYSKSNSELNYCREFESDDGRKIKIPKEDSENIKRLWFIQNSDWNYEKETYLIDENGSRITDIGEEINLTDLIDSKQTEKNFGNVFMDSELTRNKQFIWAKHPYFMLFYNPHLKFVKNITGLRIINSKMYSVASSNKITGNSETNNKHLVQNNQTGIGKSQKSTNFRELSENQESSEKVLNLERHSQNIVKKNTHSIYNEPKIIRKDPIRRNSNLRTSSVHSQNTIRYNSRPLVSNNVQRNEKSKLNSDYFGEYDSNPRVISKKPIRYSSRGITISRPGFISDSLNGSQGVRVLTGDKAVKALRESISHFENNFKKSSLSPIRNTNIQSNSNTLTEYKSKIRNPKRNSKEYLGKESVITSAGNYLNRRINNHVKIQNNKISLSSAQKKPLTFERKNRTHQNQNLKTNFSKNTNSKLISVGKLLNNITSNKSNHFDDKSNNSFRSITKSSIGHSVSIRSRSRSRIHNKSQQKFIPVNEYYSELDNKSRKFRESNYFEEKMEFNKIEGVKGKLNVLAKNINKKGLLNNASNEYYVMNNNSEREIKSNFINKNYSSVEPVRRRVSQKIRNIKDDEYSYNFVKDSNSTISRKISTEQLKRSYIVKKSEHLGENLMRNESNVEEFDEDFGFNSKNQYNKSWQNNNVNVNKLKRNESNAEEVDEDFGIKPKSQYNKSWRNNQVNVGKGLKNVYKNQVNEDYFEETNFFKQKKNNHNNFSNINFKDKKQINIKSSNPESRKNRFQNLQEGEGDYEEELDLTKNVKRFNGNEYNPYEDEEEEMGKTAFNQKRTVQVGSKNLQKKESEEVYEEVLELNNFRINQNDEYNPYEDEEEEMGKGNYGNFNQHQSQIKVGRNVPNEKVYQEQLNLNNYRKNKGEYNHYEDEEEENGANSNNQRKSEDLEEQVFEEQLNLNNYRKENGEYNHYLDEEEENGPDSKTNNNGNQHSNQYSRENSFNPPSNQFQRSSNNHSNNNYRSVQNSFTPSQSNNYNSQQSTLVRKIDYGRSSQNRYFSKPTVKHNNQLNYVTKQNYNPAQTYGQTQQSNHYHQSSSTNRNYNEYEVHQDISPKVDQPKTDEYNPFVDEEEEMGVNRNDYQKAQDNSNITFGGQSKINSSYVPLVSNVTFGASSKIQTSGINNQNLSNQWNYLGSSTSFKEKSSIRNLSPMINTQSRNGSTQIRRYPSRKINIEKYDPTKATVYGLESRQRNIPRSYQTSARKYY